MSAKFPHPCNDLVADSDRWRITVERGVFGGVRRFTVWVHDEGFFNGGRAAWYVAGECDVRDLSYDRNTANVMLDLLDLGLVAASTATERLAVELLHRSGYRVPDEALIRIYGDEARAAIAARGS